MSPDGVTKQFIGYGSSCDNDPLVPCYIDTTKSKRGCYIPCKTAVFDNITAFYLLAHPDLTWIKTDANKMMKISNALKLSSDGVPLMFGRVSYNGNYQVGKVFAGPQLYGLYIQVEYFMTKVTQSFEILTCKSSKNRTATNTTNDENFNPSAEPCGLDI